MANPGGVGAKFMSVNLNKSYGPVSHSSYGHTGAASRSRPSSGGRSGGGSGLVVLSRPRPPQKPGSKLSVPPPLNLPSLRKEHERFDLSSSSAGGSSCLGTGPRPNSSGLGWTKPDTVALQDKEGNVNQAVVEGISNKSIDSGSKLSTGYVPPSARLVSSGVPHSISASLAEKTSVLRGDDFPSLKAALPSSASGGVHKQKDGLHKKQKHAMGKESSLQQTHSSFNSPVHMCQQGQSPHHKFVSGSNENGGDRHGLENSQMVKQEVRKQYFPAPLPLVMLNPRSDWADDERDTGHKFADRVRDHGFLKTEVYWDREFEMPRNNVLPHKMAHNLFEKGGKLEDEGGKVYSTEIPKVDPNSWDLRTPSKEGKSWRTPPPPHKDVLNAQEAAIGRNDNGVRSLVSREMVKEITKYIPPHFGDNSRDRVTRNRESAFGRRDTGHENGGKHQWNHMLKSSIGRGIERNAQNRHITEQFNRYKGDVAQDSSVSKSSFPLGVKRVPGNDPTLNFGLGKHTYFKSERTYVDESFAKNFGPTSFAEHDPFSGDRVGVITKKKDVTKQFDFHDPVRESFEAELDRVQKMQEQERLRIIEEQERAMEKAHREEEERRRLIRDEEEQRRRLEEEAKEAAWRAEQERVEAIRRAEEQKIARDEEKQRMLMEEERRKQAAKQKLLELEAKIAMRQAEAPKFVTENTVSKAADLENLEHSERMVERITTSGSSDSSGLNRPFELGSRSVPSREDSSCFLDKGKPANSWRREVVEDGNISSSFLMQNQDNGGRAVTRKEYYGEGGRYMSSRAYSRGGMQEYHMEDFVPPKGHRWSASGDGGDPLGRNLEVDPEFHENVGEKFNDVGWVQGQGQHHSRGFSRSQYSEGDDLYSYGRSRYSMRQPHVLPPPSLASMHKNSLRGENESPAPKVFLDDMDYHHSSRIEPTIDVQPESTMTQDQKLEKSTTPGCDSQSSLSVSSPPSSPTHLSHDDLYECGETSAVTEGKEIPLSGNESVVLNGNCETEYISGCDDEDWARDNDEVLQEQEEYDEYEDGYGEEDEVHEVDEDRIDLTQEFEDSSIVDKSSSRTMDNFVLGFDEGVEVGIPPSDELERSSRYEESTSGLPEVSVGNMVEQGPPVDGIPDNEKEIEDSVPQLASDLLDSSGVCAQNTVLSSVNGPVHSSDLHVKLQFGLFSGPSLIPSPIPAIQIGSIQMPLHLHSPVGPSLTHMHPSQPPLFQFGQLRYSSPLSPGILPVAPQPSSFSQSNVQPHYNLNQSSRSPLHIQPGQENSTHNMIKNGIPSVSMDRKFAVNNALMHKNEVEFPNPGEKKFMSKRGFHGVDKRRQDTVLKGFIPSSDGSVSEGHLPSEQDSIGPKAEGSQFGIKGRNFAYSGRNFAPRSSFAASEGSRSDSCGFQRRPRWPAQRTEFRVRENFDRRQSQGLVSSTKPGQDNKSFVSERDARSFLNSGSKKALAVTNKPSKQIIELQDSSSVSVSSKGSDSGTRLDRKMGKEEASTRTHSLTRSSGEGNLKRNISSEEDVDAPLQSGVVCVFKQPGIEAPSDGDDFIEVRSKRQMLNDRRELREKEVKAKSLATKATRKPRSAQNAVGPMGSTKISAMLGAEATTSIRPNFVSTVGGRGLLNMEVSAGFSTIVSQPLPPIGTPFALNSDAQADKRPHKIKSLQAGSASIIANGEKNHGPGLMFEAKNKILDNVQSSLGSWDNTQINQQVITLTQTQLDEAMKPGRFDTYAASIGDYTRSNTEPIIPSSFILTKDKSFTSAASPINSLLAGEKIQFGAVTSPTVLPPDSSSVSHGIGAPGSSRPDIKISQNLSANENDCTMFFEKDKHQNESSVNLEDCEAEAEAAASAVAVAAISSDEIVGNGLSTCSVSVPGSKSFAGADIDGISGSGDHQLASQPRTEESLSVALPADLSVDTTSISLWPPLPSPQNTSSQILSHFTGGPPSSFPFYEMNPMLGGPILAFGPREDSAGTQSQSQKSTASVSAPLGSWTQCHSGVDSFYGPPAGFSGPYISPPGSIPGVQCPPHMVVYNHFPVGQFGQVGLSFMGTTYIPSGKQADWKHIPTSSAMCSGEEDMNNSINTVSAQRGPLNMSSPVQHLSPGSPLLPIASPFAMFDVSPFQSASDVSVQGRWPHHVPAPSSLYAPLSLPLQQPETGGLPPPPSQFSQGHHQSLTANRFSESRTSTSSDPLPPDSTTTQFSDELSSSRSTFAEDGSKTNFVNNSSGHAFKNHSTGYNYQRGGGGGVYQKNSSSGGEWLPHRRMGFHGGRNQSSLGTEKSYVSSSKMKQIYVAKQSTSGNS